MFRQYKKLAEGGMAQVPDDAALLAAGDEEENSIALIVKHMAGNMRSRWADFLTTDGEKPTRQRDTEFENPPRTRTELLALWEEGWGCLFGALASIEEADLVRTVFIRGEAHSVMQAIHRSMAHLAYHVGQIVVLAKQRRVGEWKSLTVPRGGSAAFNAKVASGETSQR